MSDFFTVNELAEHFGVSPSRVMIVSGAGSREKVVDIE